MPKQVQRAKTLQGTIIAHNVSPRGDLEGVLLRSGGKTVQVNLPKHGEAALSAQMQLDAQVELIVESEDSEGDHPVYVVSGAPSRVEGVVSQLNYTRHGEVNGYRFEDGTFVHVKPHGARAAKVAIGDRIAAEGERRVGAHATVIETEHVEKLRPQRKRAS